MSNIMLQASVHKIRFFDRLQEARKVDCPIGASWASPFAIERAKLDRILHKGTFVLENWLSVQVGEDVWVDVAELSNGIKSEFYLPY